MSLPRSFLHLIICISLVVDAVSSHQCSGFVDGKREEELKKCVFDHCKGQNYECTAIVDDVLKKFPSLFVGIMKEYDYQVQYPAAFDSYPADFLEKHIGQLTVVSEKNFSATMQLFCPTFDHTMTACQTLTAYCDRRSGGAVFCQSDLYKVSLEYMSCAANPKYLGTNCTKLLCNPGHAENLFGTRNNDQAKCEESRRTVTDCKNITKAEMTNTDNGCEHLLNDTETTWEMRTETLKTMILSMERLAELLYWKKCDVSPQICFLYLLVLGKTTIAESFVSNLCFVEPAIEHDVMKPDVCRILNLYCNDSELKRNKSAECKVYREKTLLAEAELRQKTLKMASKKDETKEVDMNMKGWYFGYFLFAFLHTCVLVVSIFRSHMPRHPFNQMKRKYGNSLDEMHEEEETLEKLCTVVERESAITGFIEILISDCLLTFFIIVDECLASGKIYFAVLALIFTFITNYVFVVGVELAREIKKNTFRRGYEKRLRKYFRALMTGCSVAWLLIGLINTKFSTYTDIRKYNLLPTLLSLYIGFMYTATRVVIYERFPRRIDEIVFYLYTDEEEASLQTNEEGFVLPGNEKLKEKPATAKIPST